MHIFKNTFLNPVLTRAGKGRNTNRMLFVQHFHFCKKRIIRRKRKGRKKCEKRIKIWQIVLKDFSDFGVEKWIVVGQGGSSKAVGETMAAIHMRGGGGLDKSGSDIDSKG